MRQKSLRGYSSSTNKCDEYYTTRKTIECIFEKLIGYDFLKNKIIYCPCDGEQSEFVKYLNEKKDEIKYKDFWYTSDDFNTHIDLIQKADLVITNPPFSKTAREYFPLMKKYTKNYFFFHAPANLHIYQYEDVFIYKGNHNKYIAPFAYETDKNGTVEIQTIFVSSFKCNKLDNRYFPEKTYNELYKDKEPVYTEINDGTKILNVDRIVDIPVDYNEPIFVPITILYDYFKQHFDVIEFQNKIAKFSDGKSRYVRILVKWKIKKI